MINRLIGQIATLKVQTKIGKKNKLENEKLKFARSIHLNGRRPRIKNSVGFQRGGTQNTKTKISGHEFSKFVNEKDKVPIVHANVKIAHVSHVHVKNGPNARISHVIASRVRHKASHIKFAHVYNKD